MSLLLVLNGDRKTVVCADRRGMVQGGNLAGDHYQKIFRCGQNSVCGVLGWLGFADGTYVVADRTAAICAQPVLQGQPERLIQAIKEDLCQPLSELSEASLEHQGELFFSATVIRRTSDKILTFYELRYCTAEVNGRRVLQAPEFVRHIQNKHVGRFYFATGWAAAITHEMASGFDPDIRSDYGALQDIDQIVTATQQTEHGQEIGGAIDVACIDSTGFRWIRERHQTPRETLQ